MRHILSFLVFSLVAGCKMGYNSSAAYAKNAPNTNAELFQRLDKLGWDRDKLYFLNPDVSAGQNLKLASSLLSDNMVYFNTLKLDGNQFHLNKLWNQGGNNCGNIEDDNMILNGQKVLKKDDFLLLNYYLVNHNNDRLSIPENKNILILKYVYSLGVKMPKKDVKKIKEFLLLNSDYDYIVVGLDQYF